MQVNIMRNLKFLHTFLCFFFFISFASSSSFTKNHSCQAQQSLSLHLFKLSLFSIEHTYDDDNTVDYLCQDWLGSGYYPKMTNWNMSTDCCNWGGVTCNQYTGDVIGLDLSCGMLHGIIHPNTTIFHLPHLRSLNLAYNDFGSSSLPHGIGILANSLTHLNISSSLFSGQIPSEISFLSKLVSLDLSWNEFSYELETNVFSNLLRNSTHLNELLLADVSISVLPKHLNVSSSLKLLDLSSIGLPGHGLHGKLPDNIFDLPFLERFDLSGNYGLTGTLPKVNEGTRIPLKWLLLSSTALSGGIQDSIGRIGSLNHLDISDTQLSGKIPNSIGHMRFLNTLDLSFCNFIGPILDSFGNLTHLTNLYLPHNKLKGELPSSLFTLPSLEDIFLEGNMFSGALPLDLFNLQSIKRLSLGRNQLAGDINVIDHGLSRPLFRKLKNLTYLDLSFNNFTGTWELGTLFSSLRNLDSLLLSYSGLLVVPDDASGYVNPYFVGLGLASCKLSEFPNSLRAMKNITYLDLSANQINGSLPNWVGGNQLEIFSLSYNFITILQNFQADTLTDLALTSNKIQGSFPLSICNMSNLRMLDMSNNFFSGVIPRCFGYLSYSLQMVDLGNNNFEGTIPDLYNDCEQLDGIILKGNQLQGEVPSSFSRCRSLKVLDLSHNNLNGTFLSSLGNLPMLQVLVLKSNKFHGPIESSFMTESPFPSLRVLDLSQNAFVGSLPGYFGTFKAMQNIIKKRTKLKYMEIDNFYYSITLVVKGVLLPFPKISVAYTIVDLSNNMFEYEIPYAMGSLASLIVLNLSHNSLMGRIPNALGNLSEIESFDLSWNKLTGEIPQSFANLKFLSVLNLSQNHLMGRIPRGSQFDTFEGSSFGGNLGLCGFPLPRNCEGSPTPQHEDVDDDEGIMSGFTGKVVMIGYGGGVLFGLVMGYLMLVSRKPKWFNAIVEEQELRIQRRHKIRYIHIGK